MPSTSSLIAVGWSPFGSYSDLITNGTPPSDFSGRGGRWGVQTLFWPSLPLNSGRPSRISFSSASAVAATPSASILLRGGRAIAAASSSSVVKPSCFASSGSSAGNGGRGAVIGGRACGASSKPCPSALPPALPRHGRGDGLRRRGPADWAAAPLALRRCRGRMERSIALRHSSLVRASRPGRGAPRPRHRSGGPMNCPAAAAGRCPSPCRFRRD